MTNLISRLFSYRNSSGPGLASRNEIHRAGRAGWLRAAVLGANDGIVSVASLTIGVAASGASTSTIFTASLAGLVARAMSMATGEYVSVSSQADIEEADLKRERAEHESDPEAELIELTRIYQQRGLDLQLARAVAEKLTEADRLATHAREELGITEVSAARPWLAVISSASSFTLGGTFPLLGLLTGASARIITIALMAALSLAILGAIGAHLGGAPRGRAALRVTLGGGLAMALTALAGKLVGAAGV
ncbi:MAG TPA: VIT family protein [Dehalococcoidia bacterium]|nr:VIT family protein [Dehalococcoidia bacterium]